MKTKTISLALKVTTLAFLLAFMILKSCSVAYAQPVTFTQQELEQLATNNLERKKCLETSQIKQQEIDSLNLKVKLLEQSNTIKDSTISNFKHLVANYDKIEAIRIEQASSLKEENKEQKKVIRKQGRRLTFWRIITPISISTISLVAILVK